MVNDLVVPIPLYSVFVLPGEVVHVKAPNSSFVPSASGHTPLTTSDDLTWAVKILNRSETITFSSPDNTSAKFQLNLLVMQPNTEIKEGYLGGYKIGDYPAPRTHLFKNDNMPRGFLRVSPRMVDMPLTPNLILRRFLSKQAAEFPKYVYVDEKLLLLLESFLKAVKKQGYDIETFSFVSGFRTPHYNQQLGNIRYSRHIFGDAADIYIDANGDFKLDDLNRDGVINQSDTRFLFGLAEQFKKTAYGSQFIGGIGHYPPSKNHGGFIHLDTRGYRARW